VAGPRARQVHLREALLLRQMRELVVAVHRLAPRQARQQELAHRQLLLGALAQQRGSPGRPMRERCQTLRQAVAAEPTCPQGKLLELMELLLGPLRAQELLRVPQQVLPPVLASELVLELELELLAQVSQQQQVLIR